MKFKEVEQDPIEGALNIHTILTDDKGGIYLRRHPKENSPVMDFISYEQHFLGFTDLGGKFRRRSPQEQVQFTTKAAAQGLRVLPPVYVDENNRSYYHFLSGSQALDDYLPHASVNEAGTIVYQLFDDLRRAHSKGFVYGDRWSKNILITPYLWSDAY